MASSSEKAAARAAHHRRQQALKAKRHQLEQERRDALADENARGLRSHEGYSFMEGLTPCDTHRRIGDEARRQLGRGR